LLAFASVSKASDELSRDPTRAVRRCEQQCKRQEPYFEEHLCRQRCQQDRVEIEGNAGITANERDVEREYERCQEECRARGSGKKQWQCQTRHPREHDYTHCLKKCEDRQEGFPRQRQCKLRCEEKFDQRRGGHKRREGERGHRKGLNSLDNHSNNNKKAKGSDNPYYFDSQSFESCYATGEGHMKVLQRFSEKSDLLLGIDKFRVGFYEANPNTFMLPHHWDADSVLFIIKGKATVTFLKQKNRETFNLEHGDVLMIPAGTTAYLTSTHKSEKLQIAELLRPVNTPGRYQQFFGIGGEESKSFFNSFSTEILQAAMNIPRDQLGQLLKQHKKGTIVKASQEQVRALAHGMPRRQFGASKGPFSLLDGRPQMSNEHGEFYEVTPNDYQLLEDLDVSVAYCDIKQGSMMARHYNSRTTFIVLVEEGSGYFEIARPHSDNESNKKQGSSQRYEKVRSPLSKGDVFVVPAGHPLALVASENESLRTIGFGINAQDNQRNFLAGQDNIINQLDEEAMELSFNMPAREVEEMFQKQQKSYFMTGPKRQQNALISLLEFAGL
uniref:Cupin type-1 domain-containing protein n=1 Tax=Chenopodium quinoa TaxID=63459 RepID=A0A803MQW0_CHEQI